MHKKGEFSKGLLKIIIVLVIVLIGYFNGDVTLDNVNLGIEKYLDFEDREKEINFSALEVLREDISVVFCPSVDCHDIFYEGFENSESEILCAFYELDLENLSEKLVDVNNNGIDVSLIIDNKYLNEEGLNPLENSGVKIYSDTNRGTRYDNYMHDKFCVIDKKILITGSANPTENGFYYNNNNILKIESKLLSKNYRNEFMQMASGKFGYNKNSVLEYNNVTFEYENESYLISSYMCPQDDCLENVLNILSKAKDGVVFATFAFTHDDIENKLLELDSQGVNVTGIIETRSVNLKGSRISGLAKIFSIKNDTNSKTMHHKFFVVDGRWVITGSMNPSNSGANYNDENILIIKNKKIADMFIEEFETLYG